MDKTAWYELWNLLQIYGDPEAADVVFTSGANIDVIGINITTQVKLTGSVFLIKLHMFVCPEWCEKLSAMPLTCHYSHYLHMPYKIKLSILRSNINVMPIIFMFADDDLLEIRESKGKHAQVLCDMCKFYRDWHVMSDGVCGN